MDKQKIHGLVEVNKTSITVDIVNSDDVVCTVSSASAIRSPGWSDRPPKLKEGLEIISKISPRNGQEVVSICSTSDGYCWAGVSTGDDTCQHTGEILLVNKPGAVKLTIPLSHSVRCLALTTKSWLLVSGPRTTIITRITRNGQKHVFTDIIAENVDFIGGLAVTQQDSVFVCIVMKRGRDKVVKFSDKGQRVLKLDSTLFVSDILEDIHSVPDGTICVMDGWFDGDEDSRLAFISEEGQFIRYIKRVGELRTCINTIVWDDHGNMISGTWDDEYIYIFDSVGTHLQTYSIHGSQNLLNISLDAENVLWVGTGSGKIILAKYLPDL